METIKSLKTVNYLFLEYLLAFKITLDDNNSSEVSLYNQMLAFFIQWLSYCQNKLLADTMRIKDCVGIEDCNNLETFIDYSQIVYYQLSVKDRCVYDYFLQSAESLFIYKSSQIYDDLYNSSN